MDFSNGVRLESCVKSLNSRWNANFYREKWRINQSGWWDESFHKNVSIARRDLHFSGELSLLDNHLVQIGTTWHPRLNVSNILNVSWDTQNSQLKMLGMGFYSHREIQLGGEINYQHEDTREGFLVTGTLGFALKSMESIHLFSSIWTNTNKPPEKISISF